MTVYVIQCQQTFNVKIGYTSRLVQSRLAELRTAASTPIELVKWYPRYSEDDERQLHEVFAKYRVTGEWFKSDVLTLIDHEVQRMAGAKDYEAIGQNGAAIAPAVMTVNVAVLKIGTQNMKQSFFDQLPGKLLDYEEPIPPGKIWGKVAVPVKKYGQLHRLDTYYVVEHDGELSKFMLPGYSSIQMGQYSFLKDAQQLFLA